LICIKGRRPGHGFLDVRAGAADLTFANSEFPRESLASGRARRAGIPSRQVIDPDQFERKQSL